MTQPSPRASARPRPSPVAAHPAVAEPGAAKRDATQPEPGRAAVRRSPATARRRGRDAARSARVAAHRYAPLAVVGAVIAGALALVVALVVSAESADGHRVLADPAARQQGINGIATQQPARQQVIGALSAPAGYVPPTTDTRESQQQTQPQASATGTTKQAPTEALPAVRVVPGVGAAPMAGGWTPAIGVAIANRALRWLNTPYSWDAGNAQGPTYGRSVDYDSRNDAHVRGFDCSGLVLYALAPWRTLAHSAAAQYVEAGTVHPSFAQLQPGDLVFWSSNGTVEGVGHVAIYIGDGLVVQAPHSGDVVRVTPLNQVETGTIGTTRPLTD